MTREDIIKLAQEAGLSHFYDSEGHCTGITDARLITENKERNDDRLVEMLAPFAALVAAAERERIIAANRPEIEKINAHIKALEKAVEDEREACAKVCDAVHARHIAEHGDYLSETYAVECADAIRARGN